MTELVFYDTNHPLKRRWSEREPQHTTSPQTQPLPRLPSLAEWAILRPQPPSPVDRPQPIQPSPPRQKEEEAVVTPSEPATKTPPMRNTSRERMKAEQAALRAEAAALETELASLKRLQQDRLASHRSSNDAYHGWQETAQQQWESRVEAERENKRLRATVTGLASEVKSLESLFKSRSSALTASLRQHSLLALQLQALMAADDRQALQSERSPKSSKISASHQQSPRDVSMEAWSDSQ